MRGQFSAERAARTSTPVSTAAVAAASVPATAAYKTNRGG